MKKIFGALILVALLSGFVHGRAEAQVLKFSAQAAAAPGGTITPTLTWCTERTASDGAASCTNPGPASACEGSGDWTGTKPVAGTQALTSIPSSKSFTLKCSWAADGSFGFKWTQPTVYDDGSVLPTGELKGYRLYYGTSPTMSRNTIIDIPVGTNTITVPNLPPGIYFSVMSSVTVLGIESAKTPIVSTVVGSTAVTITQTVDVKVPSPPVNVQPQQ